VHHPGQLNRRASLLLCCGLLLGLCGRPAAAEVAWVASTFVRLIDLDTGEPIGRVVVAEDQVVSEIAFSADGRRAFVASMGGLFSVDTLSLQVVQQLSSRPTCSVSVAGDRLAALHLLPAGEGLANRARDIPSTVTLALYDLQRGEVAASTEVHGSPLRVLLSPRDGRALVLDSNEAVLGVYGASADRIGEIDLAPDRQPDQPFLCADMGMAGDGSALAVARNTSGGSALVIVRPQDDVTRSEVSVLDAGEFRLRGAAFPPHGAEILITALGHVGRVAAGGGTPVWRDVGHMASLVAPSPSGTYLVMATPVFDAERGSGAVLIADTSGNLLRVAELPDLSPYTLAVQP